MDSTITFKHLNFLKALETKKQQLLQLQPEGGQQKRKKVEDSLLSHNIARALIPKIIRQVRKLAKPIQFRALRISQGIYRRPLGSLFSLPGIVTVVALFVLGPKRLFLRISSLSFVTNQNLLYGEFQARLFSALATARTVLDN